jgi:pimeloyl-ACP methyl ester carboxylesterase
MSGGAPVQLFAAGAARDTLSFGCTPIVFVPGVMGSRLAVPAASRSWDPDRVIPMTEWIAFTSAARRLNRRALSSSTSSASPLTTFSNEASEAIAKLPALARIRNKAIRLGNDAGSSLDDYYGRIRNWTAVLWGFYGELLGLLETTFNSDLEHPVFAFGYDWRSSNKESGLAFAAFVEDVLSGFSGKAKDVIVITHSMGGLVVRAALAAAGSLDAQIRGVIHGAQPSNGAVAMYRRFFTGTRPSLDGWGYKEEFLGSIMGNDPATFAYNVSGASGPLQLLPNDDFGKDCPGWLSAAGVSVDLTNVFAAYGKYKWPGLIGPTDLGQSQLGSASEISGNTIVNELVFNLGVAKDFHRIIASSWHRNTYVVLSTGLDTDDSTHFGTYPTPLDPASLGAGAGSIEGDQSPIDPRVFDPPRWIAPSWGSSAAESDLTGLKVGTGDGTVPENSARCLECPNGKLVAPPEPVRGATHAEVYKDPAFQKQTIVFIKMLLTVAPGAFAKGG